MNRLGKVTAFVGVAIFTVAVALMGGSRLTSAATPGADMHAMTEDGSAYHSAAQSASGEHFANTLQSTSVVTVTVGESGATFTPDSVIIPAGSTVRWVWAADGHTVTSGTPGNADGLFCSPDDQNCSANPTSAAGSVYEHTFTFAGDYAYYCRLHGSFGMTGTVIVTDIANPTVLFLPVILD